MAADEPQRKPDNVIRMSEVRKRQRTVARAGASKANGKWPGDKKGKGGLPQNKLVVAIQLVLFLAAVAWLMHTCRG